MIQVICDSKIVKVSETGVSYTVGSWDYKMYVDMRTDTYYIMYMDDARQVDKLGQFETLEEAEKKAYEVWDALMVESYRIDLIDKRKEMGLSQQKFADKFGIPLRTWQNWEYGVRPPAKYVLEMMLKILELEEE